MIGLIITVFLVAAISALCSTIEAMLYAVPWTHIEQEKDKGTKVGIMLHEMRSDIGRPISAVLTLNTIANTAGAAIAGALAAQVLGGETLFIFTIFLTLLILIVGEIVPKTVGVTYAIPLSSILVYFLSFLMQVLRPVIWVSSFVTRMISPKNDIPIVTEDDIRVMAKMLRRDGTIKAFEELIIVNTLALDRKQVKDVMTPRTVIFSMDANTTLRDAYANKYIWNFTRFPIYSGNKDELIGIIQRQSLLTRLEKEPELTLKEIMKPIRFVLESQALDTLLHKALASKEHFFGVADEYGSLKGVITLEDIIEAILGQEIVDESDLNPDMQEAAKARRPIYKKL